jgi:hypothetical protein
MGLDGKKAGFNKKDMEHGRFGVRSNRTEREMILVAVKWSEKDKIDTMRLEKFFSDFQERHITKYEVDLMGNGVKRDDDNNDRWFGLITNELLVYIGITIIHNDLPEHIVSSDLSEIYPALSEIDDEIEVELNGGDCE